MEARSVSHTIQSHAMVCYMPRRPPPDPQALDQQLCFALYSASLAMTKVYQPLLDPLGVTYPQYLVMLVLWEHDGRSVSEIGERLMLESSTLTPLLKRLETAGLVRRRRDMVDERRVLIHLSARGRNLKTKAVSVPEMVACATACDVADIALLTAELKTLREGLMGSLSNVA